MITRITGKLTGLSDEGATLESGAFEYEVFVPEFVRRHLQEQVGQQVSLRTIEYLEGNPQSGRLTPRMVGFLHNAEREFFELFCSVDGVGVKKALRAMVRPVRDVATAIEDQDMGQLQTLPGIGPAVAERIVAKLRRKMPKFALMIAKEMPAGTEAAERGVMNDAFDALISVGYPAAEARQMVETALAEKKKFKSADELLTHIWQQRR